MKHLSAILMSMAVATAVASPVSKLSHKSILDQNFSSQKVRATELTQFHSFMAPATQMPRRAAAETMEFTSSTLSSADYYDNYGDWYVTFRTDQGYNFYLDIYNFANPGMFDGTFTEADCELYYCFASNLSSYDYLDVETISMTCTTADGSGDPHSGCTVVGSGTFTNGTPFTIDFNYSNEAPEVTDTQDLTLTGVELNDLTSQVGAFQLFYETNDFAFSAVFEANVLQSGYYSVSSAYSDNNLIYANGEIKSIYSCEILLELTADGSFVATGECQAGTTLYNLNLSGAAPEAQGNQYDDPDNDLELSYTLDEVEISTDENSVGNVTIVSAQRDNTKFSMVLQHGEGILEAGVYPFNLQVVPGTAWAGEISGSSVYPTFYATVDDEGYLNIPLWLFSDGEVTVTINNGEPSFVIDATNTWGRTAHVEINVFDAPVAIEAVEAKAAQTGKFLQDGALVIRTATRTYNALGQNVK